MTDDAVLGRALPLGRGLGPVRQVSWMDHGRRTPLRQHRYDKSKLVTEIDARSFKLPTN